MYCFIDAAIYFYIGNSSINSELKKMLEDAYFDGWENAINTKKGMLAGFKNYVEKIR